MGLLRGVARTAVVAGTATAVSGRVARRQQGRWAAQEQQGYEQQQAYQQPAYQQPPPAAAPGDDMADTIEQLTKLAELKAQGVLSEAEFEIQKARLLHG